MRIPLPGLWTGIRARLGILRWEATVCLCVLSLGLSLIYRPAAGGRSFLVWLVVLSLALAIFGATLFAKIFLLGARHDDMARKLLVRLERGALVTVQVFIAVSLCLYANGALDRSEPVEYLAEVTAVSETQVIIGPLRVVSQVDVRFSEPPQRTERIVVYFDERRWLWAGEPIVVHVKSGALGVPWVVRLERDERRYVERVVQQMPTAGEAWKILVGYELDHRHWTDAYSAAQKYLAAYPMDYSFAMSTAAALGVASRYREAVSLLEPFLESRRDYELLNVVGWSLSKLGDTERGIALLEASIPIDPDSFWAYYHLGYVFRNQGRVPEAIDMFERVLERRPNFPEIQKELNKLQTTPGQHRAA